MINLNLFKVMRENRAENDERISLERTKAALNTLRFIQCILLFIQLAGQVMLIFFPNNDILRIPQYVYILMILPFIIDPLYACLKGYIGAIRSDAVFFVIGMIEFGYTAYVVSMYIGLQNVIGSLLVLLLGMIVYYVLAYVFYRSSCRLSLKHSDAAGDN